MSAPRDSWAFRGVSSESYAVVHVLPSTRDGYHWISIVHGARGLRANWETAARDVPAFLAREAPSLDVSGLAWSAYPCPRRNRGVSGFALLRQQERDEQYGTHEDGYVYFVQGIEGGPIKIGHALNVNKRLVELQTGSPVYLHVLATIPGPPEEERLFHRRFSHLRKHGEWFRPDPELLMVIETALMTAREARRSA